MGFFLISASLPDDFIFPGTTKKGKIQNFNKTTRVEIQNVLDKAANDMKITNCIDI